MWRSRPRLSGTLVLTRRPQSLLVPQNARSYHMPGWKTMVSTKDARTREQREIDRKARQIEKLPRPQALHDFQYPYEKTVLNDYMFQYPVFEDELDTPNLFYLTPPPNFFLYWNVADFNRTSYPPAPSDDHRLLIPSGASEIATASKTSEGDEEEKRVSWVEHRHRSQLYLKKHGISPNYIPHVEHNVNLSVVFPAQYSTRARKVDELTGEPIVPPQPESTLTPRNFWFTSHYGNYIELTDLQQAPSIFFVEEPSRTQPATSVSAEEGAYYTLIIASPDYPYRVPPEQDRQDTEQNFFVNYMIANLPGATASKLQAAQGSSATHVVNAAEMRKEGDVVIPYVAPLPTEDAGTTRHMCILYRQTNKVPDVRSLTEEEEKEHFPLSERSNFRLHDPNRTDAARSGGSLPAALSSLRDVESALEHDACALTFFQTKWDIQVQEFYEARGLPEPAAPLDEELERVLAFNATPSHELRVRARHKPDGATNMGGDDPKDWMQYEPTQMMDGSMRKHWSKRTTMDASGQQVTYPH